MSNKEIKAYMQAVGIAARDASRVVARAGSAVKNNALLAIANSMDNARTDLLQANTEDMSRGRDAGLDDLNSITSALMP
jgi:glutamate-5-semialdehyde dehydrogenase